MTPPTPPAADLPDTLDATDRADATVVPDTRVPPDESPAARCPHCDRPFRSERARALHVGEDHPHTSTDADEAAYEDARHEEEEELFYYHMKVFVALGAVQIVLVVLYLIAFG